MTTIDATIDVEAPVETAYDQWLRFNHLPRLVRRRALPPRVIERVRDELIRWEGMHGIAGDGHVRFEPLPGDRTRVRFEVSYPEVAIAEHEADLLRFTSRRMRTDLERFKEQVEAIEAPEHGRWPSWYHDGRTLGYPAGDAGGPSRVTGLPVATPYSERAVPENAAPTGAPIARFHRR
jgi:hypothetical protein